MGKLQSKGRFSLINNILGLKRSTCYYKIKENNTILYPENPNLK